MWYTVLITLVLDVGGLLLIYALLRDRVRRATSRDAHIAEIRDEVSRLLVELNRTTDRNIALIEDRIASLNELLSSADKKIGLLRRETEKHDVGPRSTPGWRRAGHGSPVRRRRCRGRGGSWGRRLTCPASARKRRRGRFPRKKRRSQIRGPAWQRPRVALLRRSPWSCPRRRRIARGAAGCGGPRGETKEGRERPAPPGARAGVGGSCRGVGGNGRRQAPGSPAACRDAAQRRFCGFPHRQPGRGAARARWSLIISLQQRKGRA